MQRTSLGRAAVIVLPLGVFLLFGWSIWQDLDFTSPLGVPRDIVEWILLSIAVGGLAALLQDLTGWRQWKWSASQTPSIFPDMPQRTFLPLRLPRLAPPIGVDLPNFGMYTGWMLNILMFIFMTLLTPIMPMGLMVRLPSRYITALPRAPESESLGVYVGRGGQFYVNGQSVPPERLRMKLQNELSRRVLWIVYFEADDDVAYGQVVYAVDTVRGVGAQAYWVTPRVRDELSGQAAR